VLLLSGNSAAATGNSSTFSTCIHFYRFVTAAGAMFFWRQNLFLGGIFNTNLSEFLAIALATKTHNVNSDLL
jgi:hypothetical protein